MCGHDAATVSYIIPQHLALGIAETHSVWKVDNGVPRKNLRRHHPVQKWLGLDVHRLEEQVGAMEVIGISSSHEAFAAVPLYGLIAYEHACLCPVLHRIKNVSVLYLEAKRCFEVTSFRICCRGL